MPRFLPDRSRRRGERRIGECTESDTNLVGSPIQVAAFWTENGTGPSDPPGPPGCRPCWLLRLEPGPSRNRHRCRRVHLCVADIRGSDTRRRRWARLWFPPAASRSHNGQFWTSFSPQKDQYKLVSQAECGIRVRREVYRAWPLAVARIRASDFRRSHRVIEVHIVCTRSTSV